MTSKLLPIDLRQQLLPGTFGHALDYLIDNEIDLSGFDARYRNDRTGASAYPWVCCLRSCCLAIHAA